VQKAPPSRILLTILAALVILGGAIVVPAVSGAAAVEILQGSRAPAGAVARQAAPAARAVVVRRPTLGGALAPRLAVTREGLSAVPQSILPPSNPPRNIPPNPNFDNCSGHYCIYGPPCFRAVGLTQVPDFTASACVDEQAAAIGNAEADEGAGPVQLPVDWDSLTPDEQLLVVVDLERVARGLAPFVGLVASLDAIAQDGAHPPGDPAGDWEDPYLPGDFSFGPGTALAYRCVEAGGSFECTKPGGPGSSIAAADEIGAMDSDYGWMYQDGWGGADDTSNLDCTSPTAAGCWGHRDNILGPYPTSTDYVAVTPSSPLDQLASPVPTTLVMGAGSYVLPGRLTANGDLSNQAAIFAAMVGPRPKFVYTWAQALAEGASAGSKVVAIVPTANGKGYYLATANGAVYTFGNAVNHGSMATAHLNAPIVAMALDPATGGYWLVAADGGVFSFHAPFYGSTGNIHLNKPIVGMEATPNGSGYRFVASDGGIFSYRAPFYGSMGGRHLNDPVVGMAADPATGGSWLVASDGGIFSYRAPFYGSTGNIHLNKPIVGMEVVSGGSGYRFVASDGGLFCYRAPFHGSLGGSGVASPVTGVASGPGGGYWMVRADGAVTAFGGVPNYGSV
jgi:hypothetical protein